MELFNYSVDLEKSHNKLSSKHSELKNIIKVEKKIGKV